MARNDQKVCVSPHHIAQLARDGIGWGHDLDAGCFHVEANRRPARRRRWHGLLRGKGGNRWHDWNM